VFLDARGIADDSNLDCELCVVGAGAAGITIAKELAGSETRVILLESGGFQTDVSTQLLYDGDIVGHSYAPLAQVRVRAFGGSTGHWEGWCRPLDEEDLVVRPWVSWSGWPLTRSDLDPYYRRAHALCQLGPYDYRPEFWSRVTGQAPLPLDDKGLQSAIYQLSPPTHFGLNYREAIRTAANVRAVLHANATRIVRRPDGRSVERIDIATLTGRRFTVTPRHVVVAAGGIENARLLLASNLGNDNDLVGRFFAEHAHASAALLSLPKRLQVAFYSLRDTPLARVRGAWATTGRLEREKQILRLGATLDRVAADPFAPRGDDESRVRAFGEDVAAVARSLDRSGEHELFALFVRAEQAPNPNSRVTLGNEVDALGIPKVRLNWRLSDLDRRSVGQALQAFASALGKARLGRLYARPAAEAPFWPNVFGGAHHIGTTRMHREPRLGVVDPNCRVHGVENLYVAGSSVFPSGGYANPTLTIVALALRLADHLRGQLA
jgi:choline dehydrogenase-like flavoprotein